MEPPPSMTNRRNVPQTNEWGNDGWGDPPPLVAPSTYAPPAPPPAAPQPQQPYNPYLKTGFYTPYGGETTPNQPMYNADMGNMMMNQMMSAPVVDAAKSYGEQFARQQTDKISAALSASHLKYYFQVDNSYVGKKLGLLLFPFAHSDWSVRTASEDTPSVPKNDVNAPDLYIPTMAIVTYITMAGVCIGLNKRFSPEQLGLITSNVLAWLLCELLILTVTKYVMNISQSLGVWTSLAFSMYKFVGMTSCIAAFMAGGKQAYYAVLAYSSLTMVFFLIRSVKSFVMDSIYHSGEAGKRKMYLIAYIALTQPFIMWWLTSSVIAYAQGGRGWSTDNMFTGRGGGGGNVNPAVPHDLRDIPEDVLRADGVIP